METSINEPLHDHIIIPISEESASKNETETETECPICLLLLSAQNTIHLPCCKKELHTECYLKCMHEKKICPMCRQDNMSFAHSLLLKIYSFKQQGPERAPLPVYMEPHLTTISRPTVVYFRYSPQSIVPLISTIGVTILMIMSFINYVQ
jgi:hypothetical protein